LACEFGNCTVHLLTFDFQDPTDTFEDIPLDYRHHHFKTTPKFPESWILTAERKAQLESARAEASERAQIEEQQGAIIDGAEVIETNSFKCGFEDKTVGNFSA
jgi:small subunit ribosomal protein S35